MRAWRSGIVATILAAAAAVGCGVELPPPVPERVEPDWAYNGEDVRIDIYGEDFYPPVEVDASRPSTASVDRSFAVRLRGPLESESPLERALPGVTLVDYRHLQATVQDGLDAGTYDLVVEAPGGGMGELEASFTVTDTRIDRIATSVESVVYEVFDTAWIDVSLADPEGERVFQSMRIQVAALDAEQGAVVDLEPEGLEDVSLLPDGVGLEGDLDETGYARIGLTVETPGLIDLLISPAEPDSEVADAVVRLLWEPGSERVLEILLPDDSGEMEVVAGEAFPVTLNVRDQFGNLVEDVAEPVLLIDECQTWYAEVEVLGSATVDATLTSASGSPGCEEEYLRSLAGLPGRSADITVLPDVAEAFAVSVYAESVIAGEHTNVFITPVDAYDNISTWSGELATLQVQDSLGGVNSADCFGDPGQVYCSVRQSVAGTAVQITASAGDLSGSSNAFDVLPAEVQDVEVELLETRAVAGEPLPVEIMLSDEFGNAIDPAGHTEDVWIDVSNGAGGCELDALESDRARYGCVLEVALEEEYLRVTHLPTEADALSNSFEVVNGSLAEVDVLPLSAEVVAGEDLEVSLAGFDAYGNAYIVQDKSDILLLNDSLGSSSTVVVSMDETGSALTSLRPTTAGDVEVVATATAGEVGRGGPVTVVAASGSELELSMDAAWGWVGEPVAVEVVARDAYGNQASVDEPVELQVRSGSADPVVAELVEGRAEAEVLWLATGWSEVVEATSDSGLSGATGALSVVERCGAASPVLDMSFAGLEHAVACYDEGSGTATLVASMSAVSGGSPILWYGVAVGEGELYSSVSSPVTLNTEQLGVLPIYGIAAQLDGCATEVESTAYIAPDDGQPVGPLSLNATPSNLFVGLDSSTIEVVDATDCSGDAASGGSLQVVAERGELSGVVATGSGLELELDPAGSAAFGLDAVPVDVGGPTLVTAWVEGGAAIGEVELDLVGDQSRPFVRLQDPVGDHSGEVSAVELHFSEEMLNFAPGLFTISGPDTADILDVVELAEDRVRIELAEPVQAEAGVWTLSVRSDLRDVAGNRLAGAWTSSAADYVGTFGDLPPSVSPVDSCEPSTYVFRPDGDPGAGEEADEVELSLTTATVPAWWVVDIDGPGGERVLSVRVPGLSSLDSWIWNGRDASEAIAADGLYTVTVDAADASGNRGGACSTVVSIDNRIGP